MYTPNSQTGVDQDGVNVVSLTLFQVIGNADFLKISEEKSWYQDQRYAGQGVAYYNSHGQCMIRFENRGTTVLIEVRNMASSQQNGDLIKSMQFSSLANALRFSIENLTEYENFNPFNSMNRY